MIVCKEESSDLSNMSKKVVLKRRYVTIHICSRLWVKCGEGRNGR